MSAHSPTEPSPRQKRFAGTLVILYAVIMILPLTWIIATGVRSPSDAIAYPPKAVFEPTLDGYANLFTTRTRVTDETPAELGAPATWHDRIVRSTTW